MWRFFKDFDQIWSNNFDKYYNKSIKKKRKKKKKCIYPYINITLHKLLVGLNEFGYIRKMLNKIIWVRYLARQQKLKNERTLK